MSTNEATNEVRQAAIEDATTDKLEKEVSPPMSPEIEPEEPEYRADVGKGGWMVPPSLWKSRDSVYLRLKDNKTAGPFSIVNCHPPKNRTDKWRYDIEDGFGKMKYNISGSILC